MEYNTRIKNKNVPFVTINNRLFGSLGDAEIFCNSHNMDVNENIKFDVDKAQKISSYVLPALTDTQSMLQNIFESQLAKCNRLSEEYQISLTKRDLLCELKKERLVESQGILDGLSMALNVVREQLEVCRKV